MPDFSAEAAENPVWKRRAAFKRDFLWGRCTLVDMGQPARRRSKWALDFVLLAGDAPCPQGGAAVLRMGCTPCGYHAAGLHFSPEKPNYPFPSGGTLLDFLCRRCKCSGTFALRQGDGYRENRLRKISRCRSRCLQVFGGELLPRPPSASSVFFLFTFRCGNGMIAAY